MPESELHKARVEYTRLISELVLWIISQGYEVMFGQEGLKHMIGSLHYMGLADDLLLFKDEVYLTKTEDYQFAGDKWKSMGTNCRWGGDFRDSNGKAKPDGNHFSYTFGGRA